MGCQVEITWGAEQANEGLHGREPSLPGAYRFQAPACMPRSRDQVAPAGREWVALTLLSAAEGATSTRVASRARLA